MKNSFIEKLSQLAESNPKIFLITGDLGFGVLDKFEKKFPHLFLNAGVAEQNMTGLATGLALNGRIVFTYSIANFTTLRCLEQIRNDASYHDANVKIVSVGGGFSYGALGISHHATEDLSILRSLPALTVVVPSDLWEAAEATEAIINQPGTCYLRLDKTYATPSHKRDERFHLGKARIICEGQDLTFLATGGILAEVLEAKDRLLDDGICARVVSVHTIKPLDAEAIVSASRETGGIITVEEHTIHGGLGGAVAETILESGIYPKFFYRIGIRAVGFASVVGSQQFLRKTYALDSASIYTKALRLLNP